MLISLCRIFEKSVESLAQEFLDVAESQILVRQVMAAHVVSLAFVVGIFRPGMYSVAG